MTAFSQDGRQIRVETLLGKDVLLLERFRGIEGVSMPFSFHLEMLSTKDSLDLKGLLRQHATVVMLMADGTRRYLDGLVRSAVQTGQVQGLTCYHAEIVPWLWFLSLNADCRIFQNLSVQDIVEKVFKQAGFTAYEFRLNGSYAKREYCVQYRETDLNFVSRLLEEEGIFYFFEHSDKKHTLVLADSQAAVNPCPGKSPIEFRPVAGAVRPEDVIWSLEREEKVCIGKTTLTDYNFEKPTLSLLTDAVGDGKSEAYDYPGKYTSVSGGQRYTRLIQEEREVDALVLRGRGNCRAFAPGFQFTLAEHYRHDANQAYMLLTVAHQVEAPGYRTNEGEGFEYINDFTAVPHKVIYRPPRLALKPIVHGTQPALVVGKAGEEIWVDKYGRVKVQFYWDRVGQKNENSSCWVRVSQTWAGKQWGFIQIPRMGQEVIVDFVEGDPDQPIITGRVYNEDEMPPYSLPSNQTQSGVKSRSSQGGGSDNYNEFRFEDKKGSEQILLHAEKDLLTEVEHDETRTVGHDRTTTIQNDETKTVKDGNETITLEKGNQSLSIKLGKQTVTIQEDQDTTINQGNQKLTIKMGNQTTTLNMGNISTKCDLGKSTTEAMQSIELKVGQSSIKVDQMGVTIQGMVIKIQGQIQVQVKGVITQINGDALLQLKGGITLIN